MLRDLVRTHATGIAPEAIERLQSQIETQLDDLVADSRRAGRDTYKKKPRTTYRRKLGHRQQQTVIKITDILAKGGATEKKTAKAKTDDAAPAKKPAAKKAPAQKAAAK